MPDVTQPPGQGTGLPPRLPPPRITDEFTVELMFWAAVRGLPCEPWFSPQRELELEYWRAEFAREA